MIRRSWAGVSDWATFVSAGTSGETPPPPCGPWHCAQANWTKMCAPEATGALTAAAGAVDATLVVAAVLDPEWPITQPTTPAGTRSAKNNSQIAPSITGVGTPRGDMRATLTLAAGHSEA